MVGAGVGVVVVAGAAVSGVAAGWLWGSLSRVQPFELALRMEMGLERLVILGRPSAPHLFRRLVLRLQGSSLGPLSELLRRGLSGVSGRRSCCGGCATVWSEPVAVGGGGAGACWSRCVGGGGWSRCGYGWSRCGCGRCRR